MAVRWSNPSGGAGFQRFRVWPAGTDSYSHTDLSNNFDTLDGILGNSPDANWPPSTGMNGGIYKEVALLQKNVKSELGQVFPWFRPTLALAIPVGCAVCDGSVLQPSDHDFPGGGTVTLPNLLNSFWVGADPAKSIGTPGAAVGASGHDDATGAPGPQGAGGLNQITQLIEQMPSHDHGGITGDTGFNNQRVDAAFQVNVLLGNVLNGEQASHHHTIAAQGGGSPMENRPRYVGLIPLCRVKYVTTL